MERQGPGAGIDPAEVTAVREGNALWPGLAAFTGVTFLAYLGVKLASGAAGFGAGMAAQLALAFALAAFGLRALRRARYFYVVAETSAGPRRVAGLSKAEQQALAARLRGGGGHSHSSS